MRQPIQVLVYPVRVTDGGRQYLLLRRRRKRGGFSQGVTGGVEGEESVAQAAARELFEETGLTPSALEQIDFSYAFPAREEKRNRHGWGTEELVEYVFVAVVGDEEPRMDRREHKEWRWCGVDEALELLKWEENTEALRRADALVRARLSAG